MTPGEERGVRIRKLVLSHFAEGATAPSRRPSFTAGPCERVI